MARIIDLFNKFNKNISWQATILGDGTNLYIGKSSTNDFNVKQTVNGYEIDKRNKLTGTYQSAFVSTYQEALQWCNDHNG